MTINLNFLTEKPTNLDSAEKTYDSFSIDRDMYDLDIEFLQKPFNESHVNELKTVKESDCVLCSITCGACGGTILCSMNAACR